MTINWVDFAPGTYSVTVYAISHDGVSNPQLMGSPVSYTVRPCEGCVEYVNSSMISGWVWKPDAPNEPIRAHIYIKRVDGTTVNSYSVTADAYREDLASGGYGNGCHVFALLIDWDTLPKEELVVEVYAVDGSGIHPKIYSGFYNNAPPHGKVSLYGINFSDGYNRSSYYTDIAQSAIQDIGAQEINTYFTVSTARAALTEMRESMIWIIHSHGAMQAVSLNHVAYNDALLLYEEISALPSNALNSERCVIYGTCSAGEGEENAANMVNITYEKGAMTVIGWTDDTYVNQVNIWLENFLVASGSGITIAEACDAALAAVSFKFGESNLGGLDNIYACGSTTQKLAS